LENPKFLLGPELQREMAEYAVEVNIDYANRIGITPAARVTCTKPAGSTSIIFGTSSGIHPHHARRYFRRIQQNSVQQPLQYFKLWNPQAVEDSVWGTDREVITFCFDKVSDTALVKGDVGAIEFLKMVQKTYENWVVPGTARPDSTPGLTHNVSNTVHVKEDEWGDVIEYIYNNRYCFSGIALIPAGGDKIYEQAPHECILTESDMERWNSLVSSFSNIDWTTFQEADDFTSARETIACAGGVCEI
jgi:ribonucleoside-diphosphate reductase alpha chain